MIEKNIERLAMAIEEQTKAMATQSDLLIQLLGAGMDAPAEKPVKKSTKKAAPKNAKPETTDVEPVVEPKTDSAKDSSVAEPEAKTESDDAKAEPAVELTAEKVQSHLRAIASQLTDTTQLFDIIKELGGAQFSDLDATTYPQLVEKADALLAAEKANG